MKLRDIHGLLPEEFRRQGIRMAAAVGLRVVLDLAGLAALVSVLLLLLAHSGGERYVWPVMAVGATALLLKNGAVLLIERWQSRRAMALYRSLSARLLRSYYNGGLLFVRRNGPSALTYRVNAVCYAFVVQVVLPALRMAGEGVLLAAVMAALLVYDWRTTLVLTVCLAPLAGGCLWLMRRRIDRYGRAEDEAKRRQWEAVHEAFRGYAEVEVYQGFPLVYKRFTEGLHAISRGREGVETLQRVPAALIETGMMAGLLVLMLTGGSGAELRTTLGVFGVAAFRMLPGVRSLMACWIQIRHGAYTAEVIADALHGTPDAYAPHHAPNTHGVPSFSAVDNTTDPRGNMSPATSKNTVARENTAASPSPETAADTDTRAGIPPLPFCRELQLHRVTFAYGDERPVVHDFSLTVRKGKYIGIQGASGAGKSTLFNLILGFFTPQSGSITVDGEPLTPLTRPQWLARIGYVPQDVFIAEAPLSENVALGCDPAQIDSARVRKVLSLVHLEAWATSLPAGLQTLLGESGCRLSGGQKQRIGIARALYKGADVLLLDEATSSLDTATEASILQVIHRLPLRLPGLTVLIISHRESALHGCTQIVRMTPGDGGILST